MKSKKLVASKIAFFYKEVGKKRSGQKKRLPTDLEFRQKKLTLIKNIRPNVFNNCYRR